MTASVRLHPGLRPSAARAHRNALLTMPSDFRIVDGDADIVVSERADADRSRVAVVVGAPRDGDPAGWRTDSIPDWDAAARAFVAEVGARVATDGVHAITVELERAAGDGVALQEVAAEGVRLVVGAVPAVLTSSHVSTITDGAVSLLFESGAIRVSVTAISVVHPSAAMTARAVGDGILATLVVPASGTARPSTYSLATREGTTLTATPYSSAARELWSSIASTF